MFPDYLCPQFLCVLKHVDTDSLSIHMHAHTYNRSNYEGSVYTKRVKIPILTSLESKLSVSLGIDCVCRSYFSMSKLVLLTNLCFCYRLVFQIGFYPKVAHA